MQAKIPTFAMLIGVIVCVMTNAMFVRLTVMIMVAVWIITAMIMIALINDLG
ncbi:hypothetical protein IKR20_08345 [bacterium]|nr:hypothetical protein [bacterium]